MNMDEGPNSTRWRGDQVATDAKSVDERRTSFLKQLEVNRSRRAVSRASCLDPVNKLDYFQNPAAASSLGANLPALNRHSWTLPHSGPYGVADLPSSKDYASPTTFAPGPSSQLGHLQQPTPAPVQSSAWILGPKPPKQLGLGTSLRRQHLVDDPFQLPPIDAGLSQSYPPYGALSGPLAGHNNVYDNVDHAVVQDPQPLALFDGSNDTKPPERVKSSKPRRNKQKPGKKNKKQPKAERKRKVRWNKEYPSVMPLDLEWLFLRGFFNGAQPTINREQLLELVQAKIRAGGGTDEMAMNTLLMKEKTIVRRWLGLREFNEARAARGEESVGSTSDAERTKMGEMGQAVLKQWHDDFKETNRPDQWTEPGSLGTPTSRELANYQLAWPPTTKTKETSSSDDEAPTSPFERSRSLSLLDVPSPSDLPSATPPSRGRRMRRSTPALSMGLSRSASSTRQGLLRQSPAASLRGRGRTRSLAVTSMQSQSVSPYAQARPIPQGFAAALLQDPTALRSMAWTQLEHHKRIEAYELGLSHGRAQSVFTGLNHQEPTIDPAILQTGSDVVVMNLDQPPYYPDLISPPWTQVASGTHDNYGLLSDGQVQLVSEAPQESNVQASDNEDMFNMFMNQDMWS